MYTKAVVWATSATPLPMWDVEGSGMVPLPNMVADFRDMSKEKHTLRFSLLSHQTLHTDSCNLELLHSEGEGG